ncbi:putative bifunctional diguanylate cyclase/phosphodiesterase [Cellvibrio japonicus]|nr:EAL domain-containing protein [Cellvibrio japonicus]QEI13857.1 EAL domain-containing protein [Cellvibrio japonicus]QEI17431.1 EAL domain-containing protein [Cellvibrio japonicus]QEI21007.1 EAL domain-containing protein [Cellvibrio japonicus]
MFENARILLVDDTPENLDILSAILEDLGCQLLVATSGERALELATRRLPDLVLLDVMMPDMNGFEVCTRLKADLATTEIPIVFVTARTEDISQGFQVGGADYITKPINADEVRARVKYQLERQGMLAELKSFNRELEAKVRERTAELTIANRQLREEINERRYMQDRLNYLATHDFVTRLHNRNALESHVSELLARTQLHSINAAFLLIDIDRFRIVNESCGCIAGDELLRQFADSITGLLARNDFFARLGGDKFAVVTHCEEADKGVALAQLIQRHLEQFTFQWEDKQFKLAASIACVPITRELVSYDQIMLAADEVIYVAKQEARGSIRTYDQANQRSSLHRDSINWASRLIDALHNNLFRTYFQLIEYLPASRAEDIPKIRLEILLRLWSPQQERIVPPGDFIGPAERLHLIPELDKWVINHSLQLLAQYPRLFDHIELVSINLSALSMRESLFADYVVGKIQQHGIPPHKICFEITETAAIVNMDTARHFMQTLRDQGCHFALDDFGSGFASYAYLHQLIFDKIKIDGIFVRDMDTDQAHYAMVKSIIEMAKSLDKEVIAEFVETPEVAQLLRELGVSWGQGYFHHRPEELNYQALQRCLASSYGLTATD